MKIYTKKGDTGKTSLFGGDQVPKDDLRIRAYGTYDELNSILGLILTQEKLSLDLSLRLKRIQGELFQLGAELATPRQKKVTTILIGHQEIELLEKEIDGMELVLQPLKTFILPGGTVIAALFHLARTIGRRAERELVSLNRAEPLRAEVLQYANRLSDYFFVCARFANHEVQVADIPWNGPK